MKKVAAVVLVLAFALVQPLRAQEDTRRKLAEELLTLMDVQENIEEAFEAIKEMQVSQLKGMGLSGEASDRAQSMQEKVMDVIAEELSWDKLKDDYIAIYADTFSEEELKGLLEFYQSPVGQKFISKNPELMKKTMEVTQKQLAVMMPKIQQITMGGMEESSEAPAAAAPALPAAPSEAPAAE
jgi:uncharacterized protein